jgi:hypothetical protein
MKRNIVFAVAVLLASAALAGSPTTRDLLGYVPANATVVVAVDSAALRSQPLIQQWLMEQERSVSGHDADFQLFLTEAGLDPLRDVDVMVVAMNPSHDDHEVLALFGGRYDPTSLAAAIAKRGGNVSKVNGVDMYTFTPQNGNHDAGAVALPSADLVIAGDPAAVQAALTTGKVKSNLATTEIAAGHVDPRSHFWAVAVVPEEARAHSKEIKIESSDENGALIRGLVTAGGTVQRVAMQATLGKELEIEGWAVADTREDAELLRDSAKGAVAALRLQAKDKAPELVEVLRDVSITSSSAEVSAKAAIPIELVQKWAEEARSHSHSHCEGKKTL